ncbi:hypothetical protein [Microbacterium sp. HJ5]
MSSQSVLPHEEWFGANSIGALFEQIAPKLRWMMLWATNVLIWFSLLAEPISDGRPSCVVGLARPFFLRFLAHILPANCLPQPVFTGCETWFASV